MRNFRIIIAAALAAAILPSCGRAVVKGSFGTVPSKHEVVVKSIEGSSMRTLDTLRTDSKGRFTYKADVKPGQPEFFYLYYGNSRIASLLLSAGDKVEIVCDTLGSWSVKGSADCAALQENEAALAAINAKETLPVKEFIDFYRSQVKYVLENSHSLSVVPVLFSKIGDTPLFFQLSDGIIFSNVADSLAAAYPESRYVSMLRSEADSRMRRIKVNSILQAAREAPYIDLDFDGMDGKSVKLSDHAGKACMLVFWSAADATNKMFNTEVLGPVYDRYSQKGLQIYSVCVGCDKPTWAMVVREQNTPWINVCDPSGRSIGAYGLETLPSVFIFDGKDMTRADDISLKSLNAALSGIL